MAGRLTAHGAHVGVLKASDGLDLLAGYLSHEGPRVGGQDPHGGGREELRDKDEADHQDDAGHQHLHEGEPSLA